MFGFQIEILGFHHANYKVLAQGTHAQIRNQLMLQLLQLLHRQQIPESDDDPNNNQLGD
jgi:hypothetical protein